MATPQALEKKIAALQAQLENQRKKAEADAAHNQARVAQIAEVKALIEKYGLSARDLGLKGAGKASKGGSRSNPMKGKTVPAKYRDSQGNQWTGRGVQPKWVRAALASGRNLQDFAV